MKILSILIVLCAFSVFSTGCVFTSIKTPYDTDLDETRLGEKVGESSWTSLLWLVAWGDGGSAAAAKNGDVTNLRHMDKEILSKGAWTTILFRYQNWNKSKGEYGKEMYTIRRYQKVKGQYMPKSKFNISSAEQAKKIIQALERWISD